MKPYGLPRNDDVANPDLGDVKNYGRKSCLANLPGKCGDIRSVVKSSAKKRAARRIYKRAARRAGKDQISDDLASHND